MNGRRLRLRGAALQEDAAGRGDALTPREMDAAVARLRRIGANATRAQHALSPALLERLDAAGILVWQGVGPFDVPGRWAARTPATRERALRRVRLDVLNARAHPSILTWNLVNEIAFNGAARGPARRTWSAPPGSSSALDPGRPVAVDVWGTHLPAHAGPALPRGRRRRRHQLRGLVREPRQPPAVAAGPARRLAGAPPRAVPETRCS